ncbi:hypothetical protein GCM10023066_12040 [Nocardioides kongjuensis]
MTRSKRSRRGPGCVVAAPDNTLRADEAVHRSEETLAVPSNAAGLLMEVVRREHVAALAGPFVIVERSAAGSIVDRETCAGPYRTMHDAISALWRATPHGRECIIERLMDAIPDGVVEVNSRSHGGDDV